mmetsp:Transcript_21609/g.41228  ORF Transcript_21609/g.41228 Transcript_21609/m.41228 type:complete len:246 (-) Transcript_21609:1436-2173(-)
MECLCNSSVQRKRRFVNEMRTWLASRRSCAKKQPVLPRVLRSLPLPLPLRRSRAAALSTTRLPNRSRILPPSRERPLRLMHLRVARSRRRTGSPAVIKKREGGAPAAARQSPCPDHARARPPNPSHAHRFAALLRGTSEMSDAREPRLLLLAVGTAGAARLLGVAAPSVPRGAGPPSARRGTLKSIAGTETGTELRPRAATETARGPETTTGTPIDACASRLLARLPFPRAKLRIEHARMKRKRH